MNALDVAILGAMLLAGFGGWRLGLVARVFAWAGVFTGLAIGVNFVPRIVTALGGNSADDRIGVALLFLFLVGSIGQAFGLLVGLLVHRVFPIASPLPLWDRIAGATAGCLGLLVLTWLVIPSLATAQGWPARMSRDSWVVAAIQDVAPRQPARFAAWGLAISEAPYPSALGTLDEPPDPGRVPDRQAAGRDRRARAAVDPEDHRERVPSDPGRQRMGRGAGDRRHERARGGGGALDERRGRGRRAASRRWSSTSIRSATSRCSPCRSWRRRPCNSGPVGPARRARCTAIPAVVR